LPDPLESAHTALSQGRYTEAEQDFERLRAGAERARALLGLAHVQLATGRYLAAEQTASQALKAGAQAVLAHTLRGEALYAVGKLDAAQRAFEQAATAPMAHRARVLLGRLLLERGRRREAEPHLLAVVDAYNNEALPSEPPNQKAAGLSYVAMAARALGSMHDANDTFREAALADRSRAETQIEWASLFLDKDDKQNAMASVEEALQHNPHHPVAHALKARLELARAYDFPTANEHLEKALAVNPNLPMVFVTYATMALRNMDIEEAEQQLGRALAINPSDLEALSVRAAARFLADDKKGFEKAKREVLGKSPRFSRLYSIIGEYAEWEHRYEQMVEMARQALAIDGEDSHAHAMLGVNLLRMGREQEGLKALHQAWERDRFNVHVFNTLNLYDEVISKEYEAFDAAPFRIRMHKQERPALEPYLMPMLTRAYHDMRKRYRFTPEGPLHIELYADPQHFSVRTTGLPNVGVQGVCFGKVITARSPRGGPFNWGQVTWHELARVCQLQLSANHVPRWFSGGVAE
jgi:tetratricopeptide (TPR) repeat protein